MEAKKTSETGRTISTEARRRVRLFRSFGTARLLDRDAVEKVDSLPWFSLFLPAL
jgi:hypothetical protein